MTIDNKEFSGERPLFAIQDLEMHRVTIHAGESALKHCSDIVASECVFEGKYPFWHNKRVKITNCLFREGARAAIWYTQDLKMEDTEVVAPKMFRDMERLELRRVNLRNAMETLWHCRDIKMEDVSAEHGDYFAMHSEDIEIDCLHLNGNYSFQYAKNIVIRNSQLNTKDAFWNTENVTVYDSTINGEYLGWHSRNLRLIRCHITGTQPLCYAKGLVMEECTMGADADLGFEYSSVYADIKGAITSVKNPTTGYIHADSIGEVILDENIESPADCEIKANVNIAQS